MRINNHKIIFSNLAVRLFYRLSLISISSFAKSKRDTSGFCPRVVYFVKFWIARVFTVYNSCACAKC